MLGRRAIRRRWPPASAGSWAPSAVVALHLNYGLRPDSDEDRQLPRRCASGSAWSLVVERPALPEEGNVQAGAREARYAAAERLRAERGLDWIATGHTRTDLAETVLYRLATSPGRRALLGLPARRGAIVRPLLGLDRERVRCSPARRGCPSATTPATPSTSTRATGSAIEVLPVLREIGPAAEATIAETQAELAEESETLDRLAAEALEASGAAAAGALPAEALTPLDPALRRLALRALAELAAGRPVPLGRRRAAEIVRLASSSEGGTVELGEGLEARVEHGHVRFLLGPEQAPADALLTVPGSCRFGPWEVRAELREGPVEPDSPAQAFLDPAALAGDAPRPVLARRRPDAAARPRRHQVAAGPVHRSQDPALAAALPPRRHLGRPDRLDRRRRRLGRVRRRSRRAARGGSQRRLQATVLDSAAWRATS